MRHRPKRSPSQRYRVEQFLPYLESKDVSYEYVFLLNKEDDKIFYSNKVFFKKIFVILKSFFKLLYLVIFKVKKFERAFIQKELFFIGPPIFEKLISKQTKLVYDFDDAIWMRDVSEGNKKFAFLKNSDKTKQIIMVADQVIVGNEFLKKYALTYNQKVEIIPTCVDTDKYKRSIPYSNKENICIGWSGSQTTIKHFDLLSEVLIDIKEKYKEKICFKVIGDENYYNKVLDIKGEKWTYEKEKSNLEEIDIGLMPLPNDKWSEGKCGLKGLVYMSMEIPAILSPVGVNKDILKNNEGGYLCLTDDEWIHTLSELIENFELRKEVGINGRNIVLNKYSIKKNKESFYRTIFV